MIEERVINSAASAAAPQNSDSEFELADQPACLAHLGYPDTAGQVPRQADDQNKQMKATRA